MRRVICLISAVLSVLAVAPANAAPRKYTIGAEVQGAVTARFTLRHPVRFLLDMSASRPSDLYGMFLTRDGYAQSFFVGMTVDGFTPSGFGGIGPVVDGLTWRPGTYDLTLFSPTRTRVNLSFENPMPKLRFRPRTLQLVRANTSSEPAWTGRVDVTITGPTHGLFVYQHDEWNGIGQNMQTSCVWHLAPCVPVDANQLGDGNNKTGPHVADRRSAKAGAVFGEGVNHVEISSITGGPATRRAAVVLVVP